jgi:hypothetical protein
MFLEAFLLHGLLGKCVTSAEEYLVQLARGLYRENCQRTAVVIA